MRIKFLLESLKGRNNSEDLDVEGRIKLKFILRKYGGTRHAVEDKIKIYLKEMGWEGVVWICVAQDTDRWHL
jgi:hypothetical protein